MRLDSDKVYVYCAAIAEAQAPSEIYRELAYRALSAVELELPSAGTCVLKPNATVLFPPEKRVVTHPGFLSGMLDALLEKGIGPERLVVGDGQSGEDPEKGFTWENVGYASMAAERQVRLVEFNEAPSKKIAVPGGVVYEEYPIYTEVADCSFFFNVPLSKCHNLGCTTLSIKNLMGILDRPERHLCAMQEVDKPLEEGIWRLTENGISLFEERFYHKLCDIVAALRGLKIPRLSMVDGLIGRDGTAFNEGQNYPLGWTLIGENEVHVDAVGTYLMGLDPEVTPYLKFAAERGLGTNRVEDIEVVNLADGTELEIQGLRSRRVLMPVASYGEGYYPRFRVDGSVVPWRLDDVNKQRQEDSQALIPAT